MLTNGKGLSLSEPANGLVIGRLPFLYVMRRSGPNSPSPLKSQNVTSSTPVLEHETVSDHLLDGW